MDLTYTIPSTRVYPELPRDKAQSLLDTFVLFNLLKEYACNLLYDERILQKGKSNITSKLKERYLEMTGKVLSDYYCTSVYSTASGMISSIKELYKIRKMEHETAQKNRMEKLASLEKRLEELRSIKGQLIMASKAKKQGAEAVLSISGYYSRFLPGSDSKSALSDLYAFECMIDQRIRRTKMAASNIRDKIRRRDEQFPSVPARPVFGGKREYRKKDTLHLAGNAMVSWRKNRDLSRYHRVSFSGRHTSRFGNFQCMYEPSAGKMTVDRRDRSFLQQCIFPIPWWLS